MTAKKGRDWSSCSRVGFTFVRGVGVESGEIGLFVCDGPIAFAKVLGMVKSI